MHCKSCGLEIENDSRYCRRCGNSVNGDSAAGVPGPPGAGLQKKITLVVGIAAALILAAVIFLLFFSVSESPDAKSLVSETIKFLA